MLCLRRIQNQMKLIQTVSASQLWKKVALLPHEEQLVTLTDSVMKGLQGGA